MRQFADLVDQVAGHLLPPRQAIPDLSFDRALDRTEFATTAPRQRQTASARNARCDCTNERRANASGGARMAAR